MDISVILGGICVVGGYFITAGLYGALSDYLAEKYNFPLLPIYAGVGLGGV